MVQQIIEFDFVSVDEIGSGTITAFLFDGTTLVATLASITENATRKGRYTGTVDDVASGTYTLIRKFDGYSEIDANYLVTLVLAVGTYTAGYSEANVATQEVIDGVVAQANQFKADTDDLLKIGTTYTWTNGEESHNASINEVS